MSLMRNAIAIVIPALNEEDALRHLLPEIPRSLVQWVIVVDNGSTDATAKVAEEAGAIVVHESVRGYGRACWSGFQQACDCGAELVVFMDGDGSDNPHDLPAMLAPILEGRADLVIGSRVGPDAEPGAVLPQARLGNWLITRLVSWLYGTQIHDLGSFRVIPRRVLETLQMQEMTFGWPVEMLVKAARAGYRVVEIPLHYRRRSHGRSKVAGTLIGSIRAAWVMLATMAKYTRGHKIARKIERTSETYV